MAKGAVAVKLAVLAAALPCPFAPFGCVRNELLGTIISDAGADAAPPPPPRFTPPVLVAALSDPDAIDEDPTFTGDLLELFFMSNRAGGRDIWTSRRATAADPWQPPTRVGELDSVDSDWAPAVSLDGLRIWFASDRGDRAARPDLAGDARQPGRTVDSARAGGRAGERQRRLRARRRRDGDDDVSELRSRECGRHRRRRRLRHLRVHAHRPRRAVGLAGAGRGHRQQRRRIRSVRGAGRAGRVLHVDAVGDGRHLLVVAPLAGGAVCGALACRRSQLERVRLGYHAVARPRHADVLVDTVGQRRNLRGHARSVDLARDGRAAIGAARGRDFRRRRKS